MKQVVLEPAGSPDLVLVELALEDSVALVPFLPKCLARQLALEELVVLVVELVARMAL
jgi:hypothetical protein